VDLSPKEHSYVIRHDSGVITFISEKVETTRCDREVAGRKFIAFTDMNLPIREPAVASTIAEPLLPILVAAVSSP
jgi:hypothetical protein